MGGRTSPLHYALRNGFGLYSIPRLENCVNQIGAVKSKGIVRQYGDRWNVSWMTKDAPPNARLGGKADIAPASQNVCFFPKSEKG